jgi:hypothetical protein
MHDTPSTYGDNIPLPLSIKLSTRENPRPKPGAEWLVLGPVVPPREDVDQADDEAEKLDHPSEFGVSPVARVLRMQNRASFLEYVLLGYGSPRCG